MNHLQVIQEVVGGEIKENKVIAGEITYELILADDYIRVSGDYNQHMAWTNWYKEPVRPSVLKKALRSLKKSMETYQRLTETIRMDYEDAVEMTRKVKQIIPEAVLVSLDNGATLHVNHIQIHTLRGQIRIESNVSLDKLPEVIHALSRLS